MSSELCLSCIAIMCLYRNISHVLNRTCGNSLKWVIIQVSQTWSPPPYVPNKSNSPPKADICSCTSKLCLSKGISGITSWWLRGWTWFFLRKIRINVFFFWMIFAYYFQGVFHIPPTLLCAWVRKRIVQVIHIPFGIFLHIRISIFIFYPRQNIWRILMKIVSFGTPLGVGPSNNEFDA